MHIAIQANEANTKNYFFKKGRCHCNGKLTIMYLSISMRNFYFTCVFRQARNHGQLWNQITVLGSVKLLKPSTYSQFWKRRRGVLINTGKRGGERLKQSYKLMRRIYNKLENGMENHYWEVSLRNPHNTE